ncbi:MAG: type IV toxin-antitoxin system AbiEi family antitoxin domain-containing protein [Gemmatimonadaceae bacterium]|nr:type IV toxin-antitoxin system AbiEi family antitoxin domain-containing protein [Gemmatimonadaceae bacterium]
MPGRIHRDLEGLLLRSRRSVITTRRAAAAGIRPNTLQQMARRGVLIRLSHGVYRFPVSREDDDDRVEAALHWPRCKGVVISHESALALHGLTDMPREIDVGVPWDYRTRRIMPEYVSLRRMVVSVYDKTKVHGIPCTTVERTLFDLGVEGPREEVVWKIKEALTANLLTEVDARRLCVELRISESVLAQSVEVNWDKSGLLRSP